MRNNRQTIPIGPGFTDIFDSADIGGARVFSVYVSCNPESVNAMEYRVDDPADPAGEAARLQPGEGITLEYGVGIGRISARGVGGSAEGGVEVRGIR